MTPYCPYHQERHKRPLHCRHCGKELLDGRRWYCPPEEREGEMACWELWALQDGTWNTVRSIVISHRGRRCEECGSTNNKVDVHHIEPVKNARLGLAKKINRWENLKVLCKDCHHKQHAAAPKLTATLRMAAAGQLPLFDAQVNMRNLGGESPWGVVGYGQGDQRPCLD